MEDARGPVYLLFGPAAGHHPLCSCTTTRDVVSRFERGWWDDGPRACPSSRYQARDRKTSRGRPPSRGHEGRLVSQTQRPLELTDRSSSDDSSEPTMFLRGPSLPVEKRFASAPAASVLRVFHSFVTLPEDRRFGQIVFEHPSKPDAHVLFLASADLTNRSRDTWLYRFRFSGWGKVFDLDSMNFVGFHPSLDRWRFNPVFL